jgi:phage/plasmid-like protein (TIGR03299 family)
MSANINFNREGIASYVENGRKERAWHRLGKVYDRPITVIEAIEGCNADFEVGLQPVIAANPQLETLINGGMAIDSDSTKIIDGRQFVSVDMLKGLIIEGRKATMRYDYNKPLAVVSDQYGVVQYQKAFEFVDLITTGQLGGDTPTIECAGLLGENGERLFITAKFPEPIIMSGKDDIIDQYLIFTTSHDGSGAVTCLCSNVRVVCNNTLNLALRNNSGKITFKHTSRVNERIDLLNKHNADMADRALGLYNTYKAHFEADLQELAKIRLSDKEQEKILAEALFTPETFKVYKQADFDINCEDISTKSRNIMDAVKETVFTGVGQNSLENGTALKLINGISCFYQNVATWGGDEKKFNAIMEGSVQKKIQTVYELALRKAA